MATDDNLITANTVLTLTGDGLGQGDPALRHRLVKTYLTMLLDNDYAPAAVCFYTEGVRLACDGSAVLDELRALAGRGVPLILCKTCLDFYDLANQRRVGIVGGMADIIEAQWRAEKVITL